MLRRLLTFPLKDVDYTITLLAVYRTARHYIPADYSLIIHCHQNLKYHTKLFLLAFLQLYETVCSYSWRL